MLVVELNCKCQRAILVLRERRSTLEENISKRVFFDHLYGIGGFFTV